MTLHPISGKSYLLPLLLVCASLCTAQTAVPVVLAPVPQLQFFDASGRPLSFGCVFSFQSQTTTPLATYSDFTGQFQNQNPVLLNAGGSANIWLQSGQAYSLVVKSSGGTNCALGQTIETVDGVGGGASQLNTVVTPSGGSAAFTVQSQNQLFSLTLTGNVAGSPVSFIGVIAPALVTFQITEDGVGAHTFSWPSNVIGAAAIDTTALHTTSQTFIWNGTTIMPVGSGFNSAGNTLIPGSLIGTTAALTNAGVFTNTQMNQYVTSDLNGLNFLTEAQYQNSGNFMTEGISAGIAVPSGATVWQSNALAGYVTSASTNPTLGAAVAVFGHARSLGVNSRVWAGNFTTSSTLGTSSTNLNGIETDLNILNAGDGGIAYEATGGWLVQGTNVNGFYITKPNGGAFFWTTAFGTAIGATNTPTSTSAAVFLQQVATGNSQNSQGLTFLSTNSGGTPIAGLLYQLPTGDLQFSSSAAAAAFSTSNLKLTGGIAADGGGFKHKRFGATCTTTASIGNSCTTTFSWTTAFADANYTPVCSPVGPANGPVFSIDSFNATGVTVRVYTFVALASGYSGVDCFGGHD